MVFLSRLKEHSREKQIFCLKLLIKALYASVMNKQTQCISFTKVEGKTNIKSQMQAPKFKIKVSSSTLRVKFQVVLCLLAHTLPLNNRPKRLDFRSSFLTYRTSLGLSGGCEHPEPPNFQHFRFFFLFALSFYFKLSCVYFP